ncbi:hemophore-related protein [Mycobacterium sp. LTG2003]
MKLLPVRLVVAVGSVTLSLIAGAGVASAEPDVAPFVNTTCSYPQVMAALNAQDPAAASKFNSSPMSQSLLRQFLAAPPDQRQRMAQMIAGTPGNQQYFGLLQQVFTTCNNY